MLLAHMTLSDKPFMGAVTAPERAIDTIAMTRLAMGDRFVERPVTDEIENRGERLVLHDRPLVARTHDRRRHEMTGSVQHFAATQHFAACGARRGNGLAVLLLSLIHI